MAIDYSGRTASVARNSAGIPPIASIVIRTYNESRHLEAALSSIAAQTLPEGRTVEIIVVDSGSTDHTVEIARRFGALILSIEKSTFSFGRSLNQGCEAASGEICVFISGHCIPVGPEWLVHLLAPFANPNVVLTYGRQIGGDSTRLSEARVFDKYYPASPTPSQAPDFCNNANAALRRSLWKRFRYNEDLTGLEDMELGQRLTRGGFHLSYAHEAVVTHLHHESWPQVRRRYEREAIALQKIRPEFHLSALDALYYGWMAICGDLASLNGRRTVAAMKEVLLYRFNQYFGSWLGNRHHRELSSREKLRYFYPH